VYRRGCPGLIGDQTPVAGQQRGLLPEVVTSKTDTQRRKRCNTTHGDGLIEHVIDRTQVS